MKCSTCKHWNLGDPDLFDEITHPMDPDTYEAMEMPFRVGRCTHPKLLFCERPVEHDGLAVADGSNYRAALYTAEDFGCVRWEPT